MSVTAILDIQAGLGEGPLWDAARRQLLFVDIMRGHVHAFDPSTGRDRVYDVGRPAGAVACTTRGDWVVAAGVGFVRLDPDSGRLTPMTEVSPGRAHDLRMNDGYVDAAGRFWAGTMRIDLQPDHGTLYRLDPDGVAHPMLTPVSISNGIDWSLDGRTMYYADTPTGQVDLFDFDPGPGTISRRRPFVVIPEEHGKPDGLIVDAEGGVWIALWGGSAVRRYLPDGTLDRVVDLPVSLVTKCAFGGPNLDDLYITSARMYLNDEEQQREPLAGAVFHVRPGVKGRAAHLAGV
jgi:sugar lactone lactonase YvrE